MGFSQQTVPGASTTHCASKAVFSKMVPTSGLLGRRCFVSTAEGRSLRLPGYSSWLHLQSRPLTASSNRCSRYHTKRLGLEDSCYSFGGTAEFLFLINMFFKYSYGNVHNTILKRMREFIGSLIGGLSVTLVLFVSWEETSGLK